MVQEYGPRANNDILIRVKRTVRRVGADLSREADAGRRHAEAGECRAVRGRAALTSSGPWSVNSSGSRGLRRPCWRWPGSSRTSRCGFSSASPSARSSRRCTTCWSAFAFLAFFRYDMTLNIVAGMLTITGYSVNDTIVIFDRVRENMRSMRREPSDDDRATQHQPDAVTDRHHRRHDVSVRDRAVSVRR